MTRAEFRARLRGRRCYLGLDLSSTQDLTALAAVFPDDVGPGFDVLSAFFIPGDGLRARVTRDRVPYDQWAKLGELLVTPGAVVDYDYIRAVIKAWAAEFEVRTIGVDPWNATDLVTRLQEQDGFTVVEVRQGFASLTAPSKALEAAILSRALRHEGHPVLRWCIGNVAIEVDAAGNIKPSKKVSTERIDGVVALILAIDQMDHHQAIAEPSYQVFTVGGVR